MLTRLSLPPDARRPPSGDQRSPQTSSEWPLKDETRELAILTSLLVMRPDLEPAEMMCSFQDTEPMREVLFLAGLGVAIGLPAAFAVTRLVGSQLYGIESYDPFTIVGATAGLLAIAVVSGYIPARRATHIDPIKALRYE